MNWSFDRVHSHEGLSVLLNTHLWGTTINTVRCMRVSLGHSPYSVWTVNQRYTRQTCHICGERGVRVENAISKTKRKGGDYFYCEKCDSHFHVDINAARNIIHVQSRFSAFSGRTA